MSGIRDEVEEKIDRRLKAMGTPTAYNRRWITEQILSIPELAIVDREANREFYDEGHQV